MQRCALTSQLSLRFEICEDLEVFPGSEMFLRAGSEGCCAARLRAGTVAARSWSPLLQPLPSRAS